MSHKCYWQKSYVRIHFPCGCVENQCYVEFRTEISISSSHRDEANDYWTKCNDHRDE